MIKQLRKFESYRKLVLSVLAIGMFAFSLNIPTPVVVHKDAESRFLVRIAPAVAQTLSSAGILAAAFLTQRKWLGLKPIKSPRQLGFWKELPTKRWSPL